MTSQLTRNPGQACERKYDLIIVGGGIHGAMLALESTRLGLTPLLLEKEDFGGATSFNSLRLIHGGFRYLQTFDYARLKRSAAERRWFLAKFPHLVKPLPCMVPLYGKGLRRRSALNLALRSYDFLTRDRNIDLPPDRNIPAGKILSVDETIRDFCLVDQNGLQGSAVWYDGYVENSQRMIIDALRIACQNGATVLNYTEAKQLVSDSDRARGVVAHDHATNTDYTFRADIIINVAGPWCRDLAKHFDRDEKILFRSMLAWNILFDRDPVSDNGIAVTAGKAGSSHTYFLVPWKNKLLAGTGQAPWLHKSRRACPTRGQILNFIEDLNSAIPGLHLNPAEITYTFSGLQSATTEGGKDFVTRDVVFDHSSKGGVQGLFSVSGVKLTTSRYTAEKALRVIFPSKNWKDSSQDGISESLSDNSHIWDFSKNGELKPSGWEDGLKQLIGEESVIHLDDLVFRRTTLWETPGQAIDIAPELCSLFGWDRDKSKYEIKRVADLVNNKRTN